MESSRRGVSPVGRARKQRTDDHRFFSLFRSLACPSPPFTVLPYSRRESALVDPVRYTPGTGGSDGWGRGRWAPWRRGGRDISFTRAFPERFLVAESQRNEGTEPGSSRSPSRPTGGRFINYFRKKGGKVFPITVFCEGLPRATRQGVRLMATRAHRSSPSTRCSPSRRAFLLLLLLPHPPPPLAPPSLYRFFRVLRRRRRGVFFFFILPLRATLFLLHLRRPRPRPFLSV